MKWVSMTLLVLSFPLAVLFLSKNTVKESLPGHSAMAEQRPAEAIDLKVAAEVTIKKIAEIDDRILATKGELMKHESDRQKVANELAEIKSRISEVLKRPSNM